MEIISLETQIAQQYLLSEYMGIALTDDVVNLSQMTEKDLLINGICIVYIKKGKASSASLARIVWQRLVNY